MEEEYNSINTLNGCLSTLITFINNIFKNKDCEDHLKEINKDYKNNHGKLKHDIFFCTIDDHIKLLKGHDKLIKNLNNLKKRYIEILEDDNKIKNKLKKNNVKSSVVGSDRNRVQNKKFFLTYSKVEEDPGIDKVLEELRSIEKDGRSGGVSPFYNNIKNIFITKEKHKDGTPHYHVLVILYNLYDIYGNMKIFDIPSLKHPKILTVNNVHGVVKYMMKHVDTDHIEDTLKEYNFDWEYYWKTKPKEIPILAYQLLNDKITWEEAIHENPHLVFKYESYYRSLQLFKEHKKMKEKQGLKLESFNLLNLELNFNERKFKEPQFWICGPANAGKTHFINSLKEKGHNMFLGSKDNDWSGYNDEYYDSIYFEEFCGETTIQFMNQLLEGSEMKLRAKYEKQVHKNKNLPIFINSNLLPHEAYHNVNDGKLNTLLTRINIIYIDNNRKAYHIWDPRKNKKYDMKEINLICTDNNIMNNYIKKSLNIFERNYTQYEYNTDDISDYTNIESYRNNNKNFLNNNQVKQDIINEVTKTILEKISNMFVSQNHNNILINTFKKEIDKLYKLSIDNLKTLTSKVSENNLLLSSYSNG